MTTLTPLNAKPSLRPQRRFAVGTTGWTADDLDDPRIGQQWERGSYEIVEGVLARMPAAYIDGSLPLARLRRRVERHLDRKHVGGEFTHEVDFIVNRRRVARPDMIFTTPADLQRQAEAHTRRPQGRPQLRFGRLLVPPTLVVESVSIGHEDHDEETKWHWYAEARVPNYWLLNPYQRSLECLILKGRQYQVDETGQGRERVRPKLFPGLVIPLGELWDDEA